MELLLNPELDLELLALQLARSGRVQIRDFLTPHSAQAIHEVLLRKTPWSYVFSQDHKRYVMSQQQFSRLSAQQINRIQDDVAAAAREGFAFFLRNFSMSAEARDGRRDDHPLFSVLDFFNSPVLLDTVRQVTARPDITNADGNASCYGPSSFLTDHDDAKEDETRIAAYVLSMTPSWKPSWGGFLQFFDDRGNITYGLIPAYNTMNIFLVPARHAVGQVSTFAGSLRYSIQGWFKSAPPSSPVV
jgi:SM-20-related protein